MVDDGVLFLFVVALWAIACLGLGWAGCELWAIFECRQQRARREHRRSELWEEEP